MGFDDILQFENALAKYTGAPYAVMTDCCTHAIEMCLRYKKVRRVQFSAFTYLSIPMTMHKLGIDYALVPEKWTGEYRFYGTDIWDSARRLEANMYRSGQMGDLVEMGVIDPLKVTRSALQNAVSVAVTILSTNAIITMARTYEQQQ